VTLKKAGQVSLSGLFVMDEFAATDDRHYGLTFDV
jgi:hypothetical protein